MSGNKKKSGSITNEQKIILVEFMETHTDLKNGKFSKDFTFKKAQTLWEELSITLNAIPGVRKDWKLWRKTWHDLRNNAKTKKSNILKYQRGTGGGGACSGDEILTPVEDRIVDLIGTTAIEGNTDIIESTTFFNLCEIEPNEEVFNESIADTSTSITHPSVPLPLSPRTLPLAPLSLPFVPQAPAMQQKTSRPRQRFKETIAATARLADATDSKLKMKEEYYKAKLELYRRDVIAKERMAVALEKISCKYE